MRDGHDDAQGHRGGGEGGGRDGDASGQLAAAAVAAGLPDVDAGGRWPGDIRDLGEQGPDGIFVHGQASSGM